MLISYFLDGENMLLQEATKKPAEIINMGSRYLWLLMVFYTTTLFASNWLDPRHIEILGLCTGAGSFVYPLTHLLADVITEVYGYKYMRMAIWSGLLFYLIFVLYGQFIVLFLNPYSFGKVELTQFLYINNHILIATTMAHLITETINSYLVSKLKIIFQGKYIGIRFILATLTAYTIDELIYAPIAFQGLIANKTDLMKHMLDSWVFMVSIELLFLPLFVRLAKYIKFVDNSDIYDNTTKFNLFSLNASYKQEDNKYKKSTKDGSE